MRCFVAIELPDELRDGLTGAATSIRRAEAAWVDQKWVRPEQLHLTLKFLGELEQPPVDALICDLLEACASIDPFNLEFTAIRAVPNTGRARMLWAVLEDPSEGCRSLADLVDRTAVMHGVAPEERTFKSHVTLVRARRPLAIASATLDAARDTVSPRARSMSVVHATVFSSRLTPHGPIYSELAHLPLGCA